MPVKETGRRVVGRSDPAGLEGREVIYNDETKQKSHYQDDELFITYRLLHFGRKYRDSDHRNGQD
jgi:hypothetical protein